MVYQPEKWQPKEKVVDVFLISLENIEDIKNLLGATSVRQAYNRNRTILIEWTMMHRETFSGLVGQYIVRNDRGEFEVLDLDELREDYVIYVEKVKGVEAVFEHDKLGRLLAIHETNGEIDGVAFELPNGEPITFDIRKDVDTPDDSEKEEADNGVPLEAVKIIKDADLTRRDDNQRKPVPGPRNHNKEKN